MLQTKLIEVSFDLIRRFADTKCTRVASNGRKLLLLLHGFVFPEQTKKMREDKRLPAHQMPQSILHEFRNRYDVLVSFFSCDIDTKQHENVALCIA